ncbi:cytochrome P450 [Glomus cerebriforme]|uniref:Cytochrome P450 n=1 Tax=Glomus cerebriforme TaxID=658196 RepID=A0A397SSE3_9GLOM|nr:cytochrome P450 [Glomus cerebriforme]
MISYTILAIFFGLWYFFTKKSSVSKGLKPLPSPPGRFFYGNYPFLFRINKFMFIFKYLNTTNFLGHYGLLGSKPSETLTKWAHELNSEIYSIRMGRSNYIILNSDKIVEELYQKKGKIYSSRQNSYNFQHILGGVAISGCPYNDYYKKIKTIVGRLLTLQKINMHSSLIDRITNEGLSEINHSEPINPCLYIRRITLNIILDITVGSYTTSINDPLFIRLNNWMDGFISIFSNVDRKLDYFPILKYIPGNKIKKGTKALRDETESLFGEFLENVKSGRNRNPCAMREIYEQGELGDHEIIHNMAILTFAGTDTIASSIMWLLAHLANNPLLQEQAHKELNTFFPDH